MTISVQPSHDVEFFNRVVNHPEISPFVRDDLVTGDIDCSLLDDSNSVKLKILADGGDAGFFILIRKVAGEYELHSGLLPQYRGRHAVAAGRAIIAWARDSGICSRLTTWVWEHARHVLLITRRIGFHEDSREDWPNTVHGQRVRRVLFSINFNPLPSCL
jgi:hypothetical protein